MEMIKMLVNQSIDNYDRKTGTYIVAYLDILGITNRIKGKDEKGLALNKLYNLYTHTIKTTKMIQIQENKDIQFKIFSDNIISILKMSPKMNIKFIEICFISRVNVNQIKLFHGLEF